eukprot:188220-Chlamydomonas_euryale.AAC.4
MEKSVCLLWPQRCLECYGAATSGARALQMPMPAAVATPHPPEHTRRAPPFHTSTLHPPAPSLPPSSLTQATHDCTHD